MLYLAKILFTGYKLGLKSPSLYVGIPGKYWKGGFVAVKFGDDRRIFKESQIVTKCAFNDRFQPNQTYELWYVLWKKVKKTEVADGSKQG